MVFWFWIMAGIIGSAVYMLLGNLYVSWFNYGEYYPRSLAAKILKPLPPPEEYCPFSEKCPEIQEKHKERFGSFEEYNECTGRSAKMLHFWLPRIFWPIFFVLLYSFFAVEWIVYVFFMIGYAFHFVFSGRILKKIGLLPK